MGPTHDLDEVGDLPGFRGWRECNDSWHKRANDINDSWFRRAVAGFLFALLIGAIVGFGIGAGHGANHPEPSACEAME